MKKTLLVLIAVTLCWSCTGEGNRGKQTDSSTEDMTLIDTACLQPGVLAIVHDYIRTHPQYHSLTMTEFVDMFNMFTYCDVWSFHSIGPSCKGLFEGGEFSFTRNYPQAYFLIDNCRVFVSASSENLFQESEKAKATYEKYAEQSVDSVKVFGRFSQAPINNYLHNAWIINSGKKTFPKVLTTQPDTIYINQMVEFTPSPVP